MKSKILEILNKHSESRPSAFTVTFNGVVNDKIVIIPKYNFEKLAKEIAKLLTPDVNAESIAIDFYNWISCSTYEKAINDNGDDVFYCVLDPKIELKSISKLFKEFQNAQKQLK